MNADLSLVLSLRKVLESGGEGKGMARSVVEAFAREPDGGIKPAQTILLGHPLAVAMRPLADSPVPEVAMLASLIVAAPRSSASLVGRSGEALAGTLQRWVKTRETRKLEQKVLRFRSFVVSGVLGGVTAMMASLGPVIGNLDFTGSAPPVDPWSLLAGAAAMASISSGVLGLYMSGKGFLGNVAVTLAVFVLVSAVSTPLASIGPVVGWGVK